MTRLFGDHALTIDSDDGLICSMLSSTVERENLRGGKSAENQHQGTTVRTISTLLSSQRQLATGGSPAISWYF